MICKNCEKEFIPSKNDKRIKFCCDKCGNEYRKKNDYMKKYYFENMLKKQNGKCAICGGSGNTKRYKYRPLFIDHNHHTGKVRGLLCENCNFILGHAKDNIEILENAIKYIRRMVNNERKIYYLV